MNPRSVRRWRLSTPSRAGDRSLLSADFGAFTHAGERIFWTIDYYDRSMTLNDNFQRLDQNDAPETTTTCVGEFGELGQRRMGEDWANGTTVVATGTSDRLEIGLQVPQQPDRFEVAVVSATRTTETMALCLRKPTPSACRTTHRGGSGRSLGVVQ